MGLRSLRYRYLARSRGRRYRVNPPSVDYTAFEDRSDASFDEFVSSRIERPMKTHLIAALLADARLGREIRLLDVGCGPGVFAQALLRSELGDRVQYTGLDQSSCALDYLDRHTPESFTTVHRDAVREGLPSETFDVVVVNEVFEHISDFRPLLREAVRCGTKALGFTTFAVVPGLEGERVLWDEDHRCFKNSYPFGAFLRAVEDEAQAPVSVTSFGGIDTRSFWFPRKSYATWYCRRGELLASAWEGASVKAAMPAPRD